MPYKNVQSVHFCLFQKDIIDNWLLNSVDVAILDLLDVICDNLSVVIDLILLVCLKIGAHLSQNADKGLLWKFKDIFVFNHIEQFQVSLIILAFCTEEQLLWIR
jgi:hypothetical protein